LGSDEYNGVTHDNMGMVRPLLDETNLLASHKIFTDALNRRGIRNTYVTIPGGHTWHVWRRNLRDVLPLLFQK
jgi:enterochelin esterase-like enzyme